MREQKLQTDQADQRGNQKGPHNLQQEDIGRGQAIGGRRRCDAIDKGGAIGLQDLSSRTRGEVFLSVAAEIEITTGATGDCFRRGLPGAHRLCHQEHTQKSTPSHDPHRSWRGTQHGRHDSLSGKPPSNLDHSFGSSAQIVKPERGWRQVRVVDKPFSFQRKFAYHWFGLRVSIPEVVRIPDCMGSGKPALRSAGPGGAKVWQNGSIPRVPGRAWSRCMADD